MREVPLWVTVSQLDFRRMTQINKGAGPESMGHLWPKVWSADKVLVDKDYNDHVLSVPAEEVVQRIRFDTVLPGTWFEIDLSTMGSLEALVDVGYMAYKHDPEYAFGEIFFRNDRQIEAFTIETTLEKGGDGQPVAIKCGIPKTVFGIDLSKGAKDTFMSLVVSAVAGLCFFERKLGPPVGLHRGKMKKMGLGKFKHVVTRYIQLDNRRVRSPDLGGTHASPGLHNVVGHYRRYPSGKVVWIEPHKRGNPANGIIIHEYGVGKKTRITQKEGLL